jgi:hypothetical protein
MKKSIIVSFLIFFTLIGNGQVNKKSYYSELNQDQLNHALQKAKNNITAGVILTVIGLSSVFTGTVLLTEGAVADDLDKSVDMIFAGTFIDIGGGIITLIGIPVWVIGADKKRRIKIELVKFNPTRSTSINGVGLTIRF